MELCPKCGALRNMRISTRLKDIIGFEGNPKLILIKIFYCEFCNSFVRSEDIEGTENDLNL